MLRIERGCPRDYGELARFHYCAGRPATWAGVWVARWRGGRACGHSSPPAGRVVAVGVLSWPCVCMKGREVEFGLGGWTYGERLRWANAHVRTISRVVVHPQFRGVGLASELVRRIIAECPTRYVEALAVMGRGHPFFEKAGMRRVDAGEGAVYYVTRREGF